MYQNIWLNRMIALAAVMAMGCPFDEGAEFRCEEPWVEAIPEHNTNLTFALSFAETEQALNLPLSLDFRGASGLRPTSSRFATEGEDRSTADTRGWSPLELSAGPDDIELEAFWKWREKILQHSNCEKSCQAVWDEERSQLTRGATLTIKTDDDVWLARWSLDAVWPAAMLLDDNDEDGVGSFVTLTLAASGGRTT